MIRVEAENRFSLLLRHLTEQFFADCHSADYRVSAHWDEQEAVVTLNGVSARATARKSHLTSHQAAKLAVGQAFAKAAQALGCPLPAYGLLTGVRPVKLALSYETAFGENAAAALQEDYLVAPHKASTLLALAQKEKEAEAILQPRDILLYVSIPFCPSRCSYCSFISSAAPHHLGRIPEYVMRLKEELCQLSSLCQAHRLRLRGVYMGGGTPGILTAEQLESIFSQIKESFSVEDCEFTCELGRPDTVTREKLAVLSRLGISRLSINTQTTNDEILKAIGRTHSAEDFFRAFAMAREFPFESINVDLIAALPGESQESFEKSVREVLALSPENLTVHSFCRKHSADTADFPLCPRETAAQMLAFSHESCIKQGFSPYYLYRQKNSSGALENTGYAQKGKDCLYNIAMMEDLIPVLAVGAGGITKLPGKKEGDKIRRLAEFKYPFEYLSQSQKVKANLAILDEWFYDYYRE